MHKDRYNTILRCTSGFSVQGQSMVDDSENITWMRRGKLLCCLEELEILMFERLVETLLNRDNGVLVIDDELISSRLDDVETKSVLG